MGDIIEPQQSPGPSTPQRFEDRGGSGGGSGGGASIAIGAVMLVAGIGLSAAGTGRVFIGLIAVGAITLIKGLISLGK